MARQCIFERKRTEHASLPHLRGHFNCFTQLVNLRVFVINQLMCLANLIHLCNILISLVQLVLIQFVINQLSIVNQLICNSQFNQRSQLANLFGPSVERAQCCNKCACVRACLPTPFLSPFYLSAFDGQFRTYFNQHNLCFACVHHSFVLHASGSAHHSNCIVFQFLF